MQCSVLSRLLVLAGFDFLAGLGRLDCFFLARRMQGNCSHREKEARGKKLQTKRPYLPNTHAQDHQPDIQSLNTQIHPIHPPDTHTQTHSAHTRPAAKSLSRKTPAQIVGVACRGKPNIHQTLTRRDLVYQRSSSYQVGKSARPATPHRAGCPCGVSCPYTVGSLVGSTAQAVRRQTVPESPN